MGEFQVLNRLDHISQTNQQMFPGATEYEDPDPARITSQVHIGYAQQEEQNTLIQIYFCSISDNFLLLQDIRFLGIIYQGHILLNSSCS
jgi:hypothetical protein